MMQSAHNPQLDWCGAGNQRLDAAGALPCAGSGEGDPAGAAAISIVLLVVSLIVLAALDLVRRRRSHEAETEL